MSDIFLSYKSEDRAKAQIIAEALEKKGYSVWWDRVIPPGKTFDEVIEEELDSAKCVLVLWSNKSVLSDWVKEEADKGKKRQILVPILIDEVEIPMGFGRIQAARLVDWQGTLPNPEFDLLLNSVAKIIGRLPRQEMEIKNLSMNGLAIPAHPPHEIAKRLDQEKEERERQHREEGEIKEKEEQESLLKQRERKEPLSYKKLLIVIGLFVILFLGYLILSPQSKGSISVSSSPSGARIYLDGNYQGTTPMTIKSIMADSHNITLKLTGYQDYSQNISVDADKIVDISPSLTSVITSTPTQVMPGYKTVVLRPVDKVSGYVSYLSSISNYYVGLDYEVGNDILGVRETFLSFNIPTNATITDATLDFSDYRRVGDPFSHFGCIGAYAQDYGAPDAEDFFKGTPRGTIVKWCSEEELSSPSPSNDLISALQGKHGAMRFQIRVQFDEVTGKEDNYIYLNTPKLIVTYTLP